MERPVKLLAVRVPDTLMVRVKVEAARRRTSTQDLVIAALTQYLRRSKEEGEQ